MRAKNFQESQAVLSKRNLKWAGLAAFIGCTACCALPLLLVLAAGGGAATATSSFLKPGSELIAGGVAFVVVLAIMTIRASLKKQQGCGSSCKVDGTCCNAREARSA